MRRSKTAAPKPSVDLSDIERQLIHALIEASGSKSQTWIPSTQLSKALLEEKGISCHWRTIDKVFSLRRNLVERRKHQRRWNYRILSEGIQSVSRNPHAVVIVDPSAALQATITLHALFGSLKPPFRLCDPYVDSATLEQLQSLPKGQLLLLTFTANDSGYLRRLLDAARTAGYDLQVRRTATAILHDRYLIDDSGMLILGTSLNGFGKKQSFIVHAGPDIRTSMIDQFNRHWARATAWP